MSPLPGVDVTIRDTAPPRSAPTDTGRAFMTGLCDRGATDGPLGPFASLDAVEAATGPRVAYGLLWDAADCFFREGGYELWLSRVVGAGADAATVALLDGAASATLRVTAASPGAWANGAAGGLSVAVEAGDAGGEFRLVVLLDGEEVERSPSLADQAAAVAWGDDSSYVVVTDEPASAGDPAVVGAQNLAGGDDDRASVAEADWTAALARFGRDLGPGQVLAPGRTTDAAHQALADHALLRRRVALLDAPDTHVVATLAASAAAARSDAAAARFAGMFAPWAVVPGVLGAAARTVPWSPIQAGMAARSDRDGGNPNAPVAGDNGRSRFAVALSQDPWDDDEGRGGDRLALNEAGVCVAVSDRAGTREYGNRTVASADADPLWRQLSGSREVTAVAAEAGAVLERFVHRQVDGRGHTLSQMSGELAAICAEHYERDALYGDTPADAFDVDTGPQVNPPEQLQDGEVRAVLALRTSPGSERMTLELVRVPITEAVS